MKTVFSEDWRTDTEVLMRLYRTLIRHKIDYGYLVYGAASPTKLKKL